MFSLRFNWSHFFLIVLDYKSKQVKDRLTFNAAARDFLCFAHLIIAQSLEMICFFPNNYAQF
jgi:hypothetical protein